MKGTRYTAEFNVEAVKQITERGHGLVDRSCLGHITTQEKPRSNCNGASGWPWGRR